MPVLRRLRDRFMHHDSADLWSKEFCGCRHSRLYLGALCRPLVFGRSAQPHAAPQTTAAEEELAAVADCIAQILGRDPSAFEQFAAECPSEFCRTVVLIAQQSSVDSAPSLALFARALATCSSERSVQFMVSSFHSWHGVMINVMKKTEGGTGASLMPLLARLSSNDEYCRQLVERSSDLALISNCVVSAAPQRKPRPRAAAPSALTRHHR